MYCFFSLFLIRGALSSFPLPFSLFLFVLGCLCSPQDSDLLELIRLGCAFAAYGARRRVFVIPFLGYSTMERQVGKGGMPNKTSNSNQSTSSDEDIRFVFFFLFLMSNLRLEPCLVLTLAFCFSFILSSFLLLPCRCCCCCCCPHPSGPSRRGDHGQGERPSALLDSGNKAGQPVSHAGPARPRHPAVL